MSNPTATISLPLHWRSSAPATVGSGSSLPLEPTPQTARNDQRWLEGIIRDAAPFSDWWVKTRIVQLAYHPSDAATAAKQYSYHLGVINLVQPSLGQKEASAFPVYAGLTSYKAIAIQVEQELLTHGVQLGLSEAECRQRYRYLLNVLTKDDYLYVYTVLDYWTSHRFTEAVSRNFEVFVDAEATQPFVFLVVSTAPISLNTPRLIPSDPALKLDYRFRPLFNVDEMAEILDRQGIETMTLRVHGYSNPAKSFYASFAREAQEMQATKVIHPNHAYIGYHWPSEQPFFSPGLTDDVVRNLNIFLKFLVSLLVVSFLFTIVLSIVLAFTPLFSWSFETIGEAIVNFLQTLFIPTALIVFSLWFLAFTLLRVVVYQRDRYRAIHYGAPDLAEFFWRLDKRLKFLIVGEQAAEIAVVAQPKTVNLIGHSMGGLVVVNGLRVLSDRYGKDEKFGDQRLGECFTLGNLVLASPDIPLELIREGRNNYVRSAMRRCQSIYLFCSDRDTVLRYLSTLGNWFSEPSLQMSGLRLGNVYLERRNGSAKSQLDSVVIRSLLRSQDAIAPTSAYDLFERFNYLDCSRMRGTNAVGLALHPLTALVIDAVNTVLLIAGKVDVHGGYFRVDTPAFKLLQLIIREPNLSAEAIQREVDTAKGQIIFLPAAYYMTQDVGVHPKS